MYTLGALVKDSNLTNRKARSYISYQNLGREDGGISDTSPLDITRVNRYHLRKINKIAANSMVFKDKKVSTQRTESRNCGAKRGVQDKKRFYIYKVLPCPYI